MKYRLVLKSEALQDMSKAFQWYETEREGLGIEFLDEIEEYCERITEHPEQYQAYRNQRIAFVRRFPFKIVFEIESETIVVYAVYHDKRNPKKLTDRK